MFSYFNFTFLYLFFEVVGAKAYHLIFILTIFNYRNGDFSNKNFGFLNNWF